MLTTLDRDWLAYAADVIACDSRHRALCAAPTAEGADDSLRWPGFIGKNCEAKAKRVLCIGQGHNANFFARADDIASLQPLMKDWARGSCSEEQFLSKYRSDYAGLLEGWGPWVTAFRSCSSRPAN